MNKKSAVATFIAERIEATGKVQRHIAEKVGFESPNIITMIKKGITKLPLDKIGPMAKALDVDPMELYRMCMQEYHPDTWKAIAPFLEAGLSEDERRLVRSLRAWVGGPYLAALSDDSRAQFNRFMQSLRTPAAVQ